MINKNGRFRYIYAGILLFLLTVIYLFNNFAANRLFIGFVGSYALPSILWLVVGFYIARLPQFRLTGKLRFRKLLCWLAVICGLGTVLVSWGIGFLVGMGKSPYNHSLVGIGTNIFYLGSSLLGMELGRSWLLRAFFRRRAGLGIGLISLIYSFFWFPLSRIAVLGEKIELLRFAGETYLPAIFENILASYFALLGGPLPAMIYRGLLQAFEWFSPILPDLNWVMKSFVGILLPVLGLLLVHQFYFSEAVRDKKEVADNKDLFSWLVISTISVLMVWFSLGLFNVFPNAILTGSMSPEILPGDVVIVKKTPPDSIIEGDIIQFERDRVRINHRVVSVERDERGRLFFQTKGDANENMDIEPVFGEQVKGKIVYVISKLGWVSIVARDARLQEAVN